MTYFKNGEASENFAPYGVSDICFGCGHKIEGPTVRHDGFLKGDFRLSRGSPLKYRHF
ncbi:MAG: hypothetical protein ACOY41_03335 [Pseudomonadota bacterium]